MEKKINNNPFTWNYSPAVETKEHIQINPQYNLFINGKFVKPNSKTFFDTYNPATEEKLAELSLANEKDVNAAVLAANKS